MNQIFALRFTYDNYDDNAEKEEAFLDDEAKFFSEFHAAPISKVSEYNAHVEGSTIPKSLFDNYERNYIAHKVQIETNRPVTILELNHLLDQYIGKKDKGIIKVEAVEELPY